MAARSNLHANASHPTRRAFSQWCVLGACGGFLAACRAKESTQRTPVPPASVVAQDRARAVFHDEFVAKRVGHSRESKKSFELPLWAQAPFALLLDYAVDQLGAVIVEVNGKEVVTGRYFPASGHYDDSRRIESPLTLSRFETNEIITRIAGVGWGFAKIQVVGYGAKAD